MSDFLSIDKEIFLIGGTLLAVAVAGLFASRVGIINIGIEGQLIAGVFGYVLIGFITRNILENYIFWRFLFSILAIWIFIFFATAIFAWLTIVWKIDQVLIGIALNIIITAVASFFILAIKDQPSLGSDYDYVSVYNDFSVNTFFLLFGSGVEQIEIFLPVIFAILLLPIIYIFFYKTKPGLRIRAIGENQKNAELKGISAKNYQFLSLFLGTFFLSLAAFFFAELQTVFSGPVYGYGYLGFSILILAKNRLSLILTFSFLFAFIYNFALNFSKKIPEINFIKKNSNSFQEIILTLNFVLPLFSMIIYGAISESNWKKFGIRKKINKKQSK